MYEEKPDFRLGNRLTVIFVIILVLISIGSIFVLLNYDNLFNKDETNSKKSKSNNTEYVTSSIKQEYTPVVEKDIDTSNNEAVISLGNRLWNFAYYTYWGNQYVWVRHYEAGKDNKRKIVCDVSKEIIQEKYTSDFTGEFCIYTPNDECTKYNLEEFTKNECKGQDRGSIEDYKKTTLQVLSVTEDTITYSAVSEYCGDTCKTTNETKMQREKQFIIKKVNEEWKINYFYIPD